MKKRIYVLALTAILSLSCSVMFAQEAVIEEEVESSKSEISIGADLYSRYVWRGLDFGSAPSIQPTFEYSHSSGFTVGCWGAFSTTGTYNEVDLYVGYEIKGFSITLTDYFFPVSTVPAQNFEKYFNYDNATTGHLFEGTIGWEGPDNFPLTLLAGAFVYGGDKDANGKQNYSSYAELGYTFSTKAGKLQPFMGFTPSEGLYGNTMGFVNIGLSTEKEIKLSEAFSLPVSASVITNPQASNIYFVIGFSL